MYIKRDYSYIFNERAELIANDYGKYTVHSLVFDRCIIKNTENFSDLEYSNKLEKIIEVLNGRYDIHQATPEKKSMRHYRSDWDLFFWSDKGWNGEDYMSRFRLSFNEKRLPEQNMELLEDIMEILKEIKVEGIVCRIQYSAWMDEEKLANNAHEAFSKLDGKYIQMFGYDGKIKEFTDDSNDVKYGFFKKYSRGKYYPVSNEIVVFMGMQENLA